MNIIDTTYRTKENKKVIDQAMGLPYTLLQSVRMKGKGSGRMTMAECSDDIKPFCNNLLDIQYVSFEIRPNGLIAHFNNASKTFAWLILYANLDFNKTRGFSIHGDGQYIRLKEDRLLKENTNFFRKVQDGQMKLTNGQLSHSEEL